ncbi:MAG: PVC-type heme-binding CxxCH protein [Planctomycetaceae bacterium]
MNRSSRAWILGVFLAALCGTLPAARAERLVMPEGAHVCIVGGGVADAMQHTGWLETFLASRFPKHQLVVRCLAYDGDEIDPAKRLRSADFGSPDQWLAGAAPIPKPNEVGDKTAVRENRFELTGTRADVILAFFGANEAHAGPEGLAAYRQQVEAFIRHTLAQKYNGVSAPKLVLFTPIAHEDLGRAHWPDGKAHNDNIRLCAEAMKEACRAAGVECVDLFAPTLEVYAKEKDNLTDDGIHPNERGDRVISRIIDESLFGAQPARDPAALERLRQAVIDKNFYWFNRYRVTDGYSTYGGRAWLKFVDGQTNYEVGQRELEYLDVKTANRDKRIWATAASLADPKAGLVPVDDSGLPELIPVKTNKPGPLPGGKHAFLSGEDAIAKMTVHKGMKVELVADESRFPELVNPVQMSFDTKGRLWVAAWRTYPHWRPDEKMDDKLLILEDADGDGRTDKVKAFAGDLHNPTGFEFWGKGVIVAQGPDVLYLEDTNGDDVYDVRRRIIGGLDTADTHHTANSFTLDPSGSLYFQEGTFHHSQPETPWGPPVRVANGAVFRHEPRTGKTVLYTSYSFANPHGHVFGRWGDDVCVDGTGAVPYWGSVFSTRLDGMDKHGGAPTVYQQRTRPCPAIEILSSPHFPAELQGNLLVGNVIGFQGILQYAFAPSADAGKDAFPAAVEVEPIVSSSDPNFRPADIEVGPDGAIYFTDWQNPIIGHMQHNLRDPSRDQAHGRVYRVVRDGTPTVKPVAVAGRPVADVVKLLADPTDRVRYRARIELSGRPEAEVVPAVKSWLTGLDASAAEHEHHRLEALWMLRHFDQIDVPLIEKVLASKDSRARAAGLRVLAAITDRVPQALDMVLRGAADESLRVRLEAVRTASYLRQPEAIEALAIVSELPGDRFMDYVKKEAARVLVPEYERARKAGARMAFKTPAGERFLYASLSNDELAREPRSPGVFRAMLLRAGLDERLRAEAVEGIAKADGTSVVKVAADALRALDGRDGEVDSGVVFDLIRVLLSRPKQELADLRADMEKLATSAKRPVMRRIGYVGLMNIDTAAAGGGDPSARAWELAGADQQRLVDLVEALPLVSDPGVAGRLYDRMLPLLSTGTAGRIELPAPRPKDEIAVANEADMRASAIRRAVFGAIVGVKGREQEAFRTIAAFVRSGVDRDAAVRALSRIPVANWPADEAPALLDALVAGMRKASAEERSTDAGLAAWQFAETVTTLLPAADGKTRRAELADLGVRVVRIGTVYERMAYDRETVAVQAGKPVLFVLENADVMPHNFVITKPGRMQALGEAAEAQAQDPGFAKQGFVPTSPDVLASSPLMQPQAVVRVNFQAPTEPGVYPYVCTYPGHWRRMYGALYVVDDLEGYLADPEKHLASHPLPIRDDLLKDRRPRTQWTLADIETDLAAMEKGRSFAHGRELFRTASCVACHKLGSEGNAFGPELAKLDAKMTAVEIARHVLEPSLKIDEKYRSTTVVTDDGRSVTGLVVAETPTELAIVENPVAKAEPLKVAKSAIDERTTSPVSIMPKGLLDKLSRDEILDLVAYVAARGDESSCLFNPDGCPHHGAKAAAP